MLAPEMTPGGPVGKQIQLQGQSDDPRSPWHTEQIQRYSEDNYLDILFTEAQVLADRRLTTKVLKE